MLKGLYNYFCSSEDKRLSSEILIINKSININNMNKLLDENYKVSVCANSSD